MNSPAFPNISLQLKEIESGLSAYICPKSGGVWIPLQNYLAWQATHRIINSQTPDKYEPLQVADSKQPTLLCPESGRLLIRYRVGHGLNFHIDHSPVTGGVWLDKGEWEALKSKGLHVELNLIFTASYQRAIRSAEYQQALEQSFRDRIGSADFQKVLEFKNWLTDRPNQRDICCYLLNNVTDRVE